MKKYIYDFYENVLNNNDANLLYSNNNDLSINLRDRLINKTQTIVFNIQCICIFNYLDLYTVLYDNVILNYGNNEDALNFETRFLEILTKDSNDFLAFENMLSFIVQTTIYKKNSLSPVFIFNDFEYLFNGDIDLLWKLRATMQSNKEIKYIATVRDEKSIKLTSKHPFYKYFNIVNSSENMKYSLINKLGASSIKLTDIEIEFLVKYLNEDIVKLELFITILKRILYADKSFKYNIAQDNIDLIFNTLENMHNLNIPLYKELMVNLKTIKHGLFIYKFNYLSNNKQYEFILYNGYLNSPINDFKEDNYYRIIRKLEKKGFLKKEDNSYVYSDSMFLAFIFGRMNKEAIKNDFINFSNRMNYDY